MVIPWLLPGLLDVHLWLHAHIHWRLLLVEALHSLRWKIGVAFDRSARNHSGFRWTCGHLQRSGFFAETGWLTMVLVLCDSHTTSFHCWWMSSLQLTLGFAWRRHIRTWFNLVIEISQRFVGFAYRLCTVLHVQCFNMERVVGAWCGSAEMCSGKQKTRRQ